MSAPQIHIGAGPFSNTPFGVAVSAVAVVVPPRTTAGATDDSWVKMRSSASAAHAARRTAARLQMFRKADMRRDLREREPGGAGGYAVNIGNGSATVQPFGIRFRGRDMKPQCATHWRAVTKFVSFHNTGAGSFKLRLTLLITISPRVPSLPVRSTSRRARRSRECRLDTRHSRVAPASARLFRTPSPFRFRRGDWAIGAG